MTFQEAQEKERRQREALRQEQEKKRQDYLDGAITFQEYYLWLAREIHITAKSCPVTLEEIKKSKDPHLNDIPLGLWDKQDSLVRAAAGRAGLKVWSLSDTVCLLKALAHEVRGF